MEKGLVFVGGDGGEAGELSWSVAMVAVGGGGSWWLVAEVAASRGWWPLVADFGRDCRCRRVAFT